MFKSTVLFVLVLAITAAEVPQENPGNFQGYFPSGWRPSGAVFRLPERTAALTQNLYNLPTQGVNNKDFRPNQPSSDYGIPAKPLNFANQEYLPPRDALSPPQNQPPLSYGPPVETTTEIDEATTTTELPSTTTAVNDQEQEENNSETANNKAEDLEKENLEDGSGDNNAEEGIYYIYHPSGLLQKVSYATQDDQAKMAFSAKLKYENVEPINNPVYTYDPKTYVFQRIH